MSAHDYLGDDFKSQGSHVPYNVAEFSTQASLGGYAVDYVAQGTQGGFPGSLLIRQHGRLLRATNWPIDGGTPTRLLGTPTRVELCFGLIQLEWKRISMNTFDRSSMRESQSSA